MNLFFTRCTFSDLYFGRSIAEQPWNFWDRYRNLPSHDIHRKCPKAKSKNIYKAKLKKKKKQSKKLFFSKRGFWKKCLSRSELRLKGPQVFRTLVYLYKKKHFLHTTLERFVVTKNNKKHSKENVSSVNRTKNEIKNSLSGLLMFVIIIKNVPVQTPLLTCWDGLIGTKFSYLMLC